jgi:cytochrome c biogenesis factor
MDWKATGGKVAHIGLGVFLLGVIGSGRYNTMSQTALPLNQPVETLGYTLTYTGYSPTSDNKYSFHVDVERDGKSFTLSPVMFDGGQQGMMRNPDIASFLTRDFYISPLSLQEPESDPTGQAETFTIEKGKSVSVGQCLATFVKFDMSAHDQSAMSGTASGEMTVGSVLEVSDGAKRETITPAVVYSMGGRPTYRPSQSKLLDATVQLVSMNVGGMGTTPSTVTIGVHRDGSIQPKTEALIVEASVKPLIGLVWAGTIVMFGGLFLATMKRLGEE